MAVLGKVLWAGKANQPLKLGTLSRSIKGILLTQWRQCKLWFEKGWAPTTPVINFEGKSGVDVAGAGACQGLHQSDHWMADSKTPAASASEGSIENGWYGAGISLSEKERPSHSPMVKGKAILLSVAIVFLCHVLWLFSSVRFFWGMN